MTTDTTVQVYNFRLLNRGFESAPTSPFKATRRVIVEILGGDPIEGTAETVQADELDQQGRFRRVATFWGDLN